MPEKPVFAGPIANVVAQAHPDEYFAVAEQEGPFVFADARTVSAWQGLRMTSRWKTWALGDINNLPIQWPRFSRYHGKEEDAEAARQLLRGAISKSLEDTVFQPPANPMGNHEKSAFDMIFSKQADGSLAGPLGALMKEVSSDWDYAMHVVPGLGSLEATTVGGPKMIGYRPPPSLANVAFVKGLNDRVDHVVIAFSPGELDAKADLEACLPGAAPDGHHDDFSLDVPSGVLVVFWSRIEGDAIMAPFGADPAMGLATGPLAKQPCVPLSSGVEGLDERLPGPPAWAFLVNPGKWTARYWYKDTPDGAGLSCCVFSRDGSASWHKELPDGFPNAFPNGMPPDPMTATKNAFTKVAQDKAQDYAKDMVRDQLKALLPEFLWPLIPGQGGNVSAKLGKMASDYFWETVGGCLFSLVFFGVVAVVLAGVALIVIVALIQSMF
jgi:hypothetical protein